MSPTVISIVSHYDSSDVSTPIWFFQSLYLSNEFIFLDIKLASFVKLSSSSTTYLTMESPRDQGRKAYLYARLTRVLGEYKVDTIETFKL